MGHPVSIPEGSKNIEYKSMRGLGLKYIRGGGGINPVKQRSGRVFCTKNLTFPEGNLLYDLAYQLHM